MSIYKQLTHLRQRYQIYALMKAGHNQSEIAHIIRVHKSTISRELRRNRGQKGYRPKQAHQFALNRRKKARYRIDASTWILIGTLIRQEWSPEQVLMWVQLGPNGQRLNMTELSESEAMLETGESKETGGVRLVFQIENSYLGFTEGRTKLYIFDSATTIATINWMDLFFPVEGE